MIIIFFTSSRMVCKRGIKQNPHTRQLKSFKNSFLHFISQPPIFHTENVTGMYLTLGFDTIVH